MESNLSDVIKNEEKKEMKIHPDEVTSSTDADVFMTSQDENFRNDVKNLETDVSENLLSEDIVRNVSDMTEENDVQQMTDDNVNVVSGSSTGYAEEQGASFKETEQEQDEVEREQTKCENEKHEKVQAVYKMKENEHCKTEGDEKVQMEQWFKEKEECENKNKEKMHQDERKIKKVREECDIKENKEGAEDEKVKQEYEIAKDIKVLQECTVETEEKLQEKCEIFDSENCDIKKDQKVQRKFEIKEVEQKKCVIESDKEVQWKCDVEREEKVQEIYENKENDQSEKEEEDEIEFAPTIDHIEIICMSEGLPDRHQRVEITDREMLFLSNDLHSKCTKAPVECDRHAEEIHEVSDESLICSGVAPVEDDVDLISLHYEDDFDAETSSKNVNIAKRVVITETKIERRLIDSKGTSSIDSNESGTGAFASAGPTDEFDMEEDMTESCIVDDHILAACAIYSQYLSDTASFPDSSTLNIYLESISNCWFMLTGHKSSDADVVQIYLSTFQTFGTNLIKNIVNLIDNDGNSAMHYSVSYGNIDIIKLLVETGYCDVNIQNKAGYTAVMLASLLLVDMNQHRQLISQLFLSGDVNMMSATSGQTALMLAASHGCNDMVELLLESDAEINLRDEDGSSALMCASEHGHLDVVKTLLSHPSCDSTLTDVDGSNALSIAMDEGHHEIGVFLYAHMKSLENDESEEDDL